LYECINDFFSKNVFVSVNVRVDLDHSVGNQDQDNHQVKQIYSNKCLFPMLYQIASVDQLEHADQKQNSRNYQDQGDGPVPDNGSGREH
jgi:hypothetical protein